LRNSGYVLFADHEEAIQGRHLLAALLEQPRRVLQLVAVARFGRRRAGGRMWVSRFEVRGSRFRNNTYT
jgi:hypothetical protein